MSIIKIVFVILSLCLVHRSESQASSLKNITFGALFDSDDTIQAEAFKVALGAVLTKKELVPGTKLDVVLQNITTNTFNSLKDVCQFIWSGKTRVSVIFGPQSLANSALVQSITGYLKIAHIEIRKDNRWMHSESSSVNLHPHPVILGQAFRDLIKHFGWSRFVIIVEDNDGIVNNKDIFDNQDQKSEFGIVLRNLPPDRNYTSLLKGLKTTGRRNMIIDCQTNKIFNFLKQAQQLGMVNENYHFIFTSLDMETLKFEEFRLSGVNITALRLIDPTTFAVSHVVDIFSKHRRNLTNSYTLSTEVALMIDAVFLSVKALKYLNDNNFALVNNASCDDDVANGTMDSKIIAYLKQERNYNAMSGPLLLNENGLRLEFKVDVISLTESGKQPFVKIGNWSSIIKNIFAPGLQMISPTGSSLAEEDLQVDRPIKRHLNITTILNDPYVMLKQYWDRQTSGSIYEGFCIDLLDELAKLFGFTYTIQPTKDKRYGTQNQETGQWNGMIGDLQRGIADMAMADVTMTKARMEVVDFSVPFLHHGLSIVYRKPKNDVLRMTYLRPFSSEVWIFLVVAFLIVSVLFCCFARLSKDEWYPPKSCNKDSSHLQNDFGLGNSFWFTLSTLMQQGYYHRPRSLAPRLIATIWCGFSLVIVCFYVGASINRFQKNLSSKTYPFTSVAALERSSTVRYGCIRSGSTESFFKNSNIAIYQRMWSKMLAMEPSPFVASYKEGIGRVQMGNYALFIEGPTSEYAIEKYCDLYRVGGLLDYKGYGVALAKGSPYTDIISQGILVLQEKGTLNQLKQKWWKHKNLKHECPDEQEEFDALIPLQPAYLKGLFYDLIMVMLLAILTGIGEFIWWCYNKSTQTKEPMVRVVRNLLSSSFRPIPSTVRIPDQSLVVNEEIVDDIE